MKSIQSVLDERKQVNETVAMILTFKTFREPSRAAIDDVCDTIIKFFPPSYSNSVKALKKELLSNCLIQPKLTTKEVEDVSHGFLIHLLSDKINSVNLKLLKRTFLEKLEDAAMSKDYAFIRERLERISTESSYSNEDHAIRSNGITAHFFFGLNVVHDNMSKEEIKQFTVDCSQKYLEFMDLD